MQDSLRRINGISVIPAPAGIHNNLKNMDSHFRGNDKKILT